MTPFQKRRRGFHFAIIAITTLLGACTGIPEGVTPVTEFNANKYMETWYEIARLDHPFERGLSNVTATYALREDGSVSVTNRGYNVEECEWDDIEGIANFQGDPSVGSLTVKFFGPFGGGYHIFALDKENYAYAMVAGPTRAFLWILSRTATLEANKKEALIRQAEEAGFPVEDLILVDHGDPYCQSQ